MSININNFESFCIEVELSEEERGLVRQYQQREGLADFDTALMNIFYDRLHELKEMGRFSRREFRGQTSNDERVIRERKEEL